MLFFTRLFGCLLSFIVSTALFAHINPKLTGSSGVKRTILNNCAAATQRTVLSINNVRATLLNGGDLWWNPGEGGYVVPNFHPASGIAPVSSIFAGAVWMGGYDDVGNLKVAAQTYSTPERTDFWPGPLTNTGVTSSDTCQQWDRFFKVSGESIRNHIKSYESFVQNGYPSFCNSIPDDILKWPAKGNPWLPLDGQGLAPFHDQDLDEIYNPCYGDYPLPEIRGCSPLQYPDEMIYWIFNDAGNVHTNTQGDPIRMEVHALAFGYNTSDELKDMTFQHFKFINRATSIIDSCFFALWLDPDLGCPDDDYIGCDTLRDLMYVYNEDQLDGINSCKCGGINTYCDDIPMLGIDILSGPRSQVAFCDTVPLNWVVGEDVIDIISDIVYNDTLRIICGERRIEVRMSSFTYYNNGNVGNWPAAQTDPLPGAPLEFYRLMSGSWRDGAPFVHGGSGYNTSPGAVRMRFAFPDPPSDIDGWSMSTAGLPFGDRRTIQSTGPMRLDPGQVEEMLLGVIWVPHIDHPNPDLTRLFSADGYAQSLFNNCFGPHSPQGPDAPDIDIIEAGNELILMLSNDPLTSNNAGEQYVEAGASPDEGIVDDYYRFEGYKIYQFSGPDVTFADRNDTAKSRVVFQCDIRNGVTDIYNWYSIPNPDSFATESIWLPELKVQGADAGIRRTFRFTKDLFATGDDGLVNYKKYYFAAVAYGNNNYTPFDPATVVGQKTPYIEGRVNAKIYEATPRPLIYIKPDGPFGEQPIVTRLSGAGAGGNFLDITHSSAEAILNGTNQGEVVYQIGAAPINVQVLDPLISNRGCFVLEFYDEDGMPSMLDENARWRLFPENDPMQIIYSQYTIEQPYEQVIDPYGFSLFIGQTADVGDQADSTNGAIGIEIEYLESGKPNWVHWFEDEGVSDSILKPVFDFMKQDGLDPDQAFTKIIKGFYPFHLCDYRKSQPPENLFGYMVTPAWLHNSKQSLHTKANLANLNNVDIVLTSDKSKWSKCIVVETANTYFTDLGLTTEGGSENMERRYAPSVTKDDNNGDSLPDVDPAESDYGFGWFPGYAIDVETGERLNIFFGENSIYTDVFQSIFPDYPANGDDMMWNPGKKVFSTSGGGGFPPVSDFSMGGMHYVYVTHQPYDECESLKGDLSITAGNFNKIRALSNITWTGIPLTLNSGMLSYADGLIPNDMLIKLRVDNPYQMSLSVGSVYEYPKYRICFEEKAEIPTTYEGEKDSIPVDLFPNTNLGSPDRYNKDWKVSQMHEDCTISIFALDGKLVYQHSVETEDSYFNFGGNSLETGMILQAIESDILSGPGQSVPAVVYLVHIDLPGVESRVVKWFYAGI